MMGVPFADALRDFQVGLANILEQFCQLGPYCRVFLEQQLFEHDAVDADHLLQMISKKVHDDACSTRLLSLRITAVKPR
jgi:hypothetical protein